MLHTFILYFLLFLNICFSLYSRSYLYPIISYRTKSNKMLIFLQDSLNSSSIFEWDTKSGKADQISLSWHEPLLVKLLPDETGFSFLYDGIIRVKYTHKRSIKTIELSQPVFMIRSLSWIDNGHCYFTARQHEKFGHSIYMTDLTGELSLLVSDGAHDCLYPSIVDSHIFYIHRNLERTEFTIAMLPFGDAISHEHIESKQLINFDISGEQIGFLKMTTAVQGFFVGFKNSGNMVLFSYYSLIKSNLSVWSYEKLFEFHVPRDMIFGESENRIREAVIPFIPQISPHEHLISYIDYGSELGKIFLIFYDIKNKKIFRKLQVSHLPKHQQNVTILGMAWNGDRFFLGGELNKPFLASHSWLPSIRESVDSSITISLKSFRF